MTLHSPSLVPGHTPYVRDPQALDAFLDRVDNYCQFFFGTLQGAADTPEDFWTRMLNVHWTIVASGPDSRYVRT
jgi:hypothetical protein